MRVTDQMKYASVTQNLGNIQERHAAAAAEASSGSKLQSPSSDPIAYAQALRARAQLANTKGYRDTIKVVQGDAEQAESALAQVGDLLQQAHSLAMQGATDSVNASERAMIAKQVADIRQQIVTLANSKGERGYLFGGTLTTAIPFSAAGVFSGNASDQTVEVGPGQLRAVNASGALAFTVAGGRDVFTDLNNLEAGLNTDNRAQIAASLDALAASHDQVSTERGRSGLTVSQLQASESVLSQVDIDLKKVDENASSVDPYKAYSSLNQLGQSLERAVTVAQSVFQASQVPKF